MFTQANTEGYTDDQLDAFNREWLERVAALGLEEYTPEYDQAENNFADEIARR